MADFEKLVVENCGSHSNGMDLAAIMALVNANKGMSPEALMAMCQKQGLGGADGGGLFIFILLILLLGGNGGGLFGGNNREGGVAPQIQNNFDTSVLLRAVDGNTADIRALAQTLNCDFNRVSDALCSIKGGIDKVAGEVSSTSKDVVNAIQAGNCQISRQLSDCCCGIERSILTQTNAMTQGFAQLGFATQQQTCDITTAIHAEGEATRALIRENELLRVREENVALKLQVSQFAQTTTLERSQSADTAAILAAIAAK